MFVGKVSGFLGISMLRFQLMFLKLSSLDRAFPELLYGILYFSVAQMFVDFLIFLCLRILRNFVDMKNGKIWSLLSSMFQEKLTVIETCGDRKSFRKSHI